MSLLQSYLEHLLERKTVLESKGLVEPPSLRDEIARVREKLVEIDKMNPDILPCPFCGEDPFYQPRETPEDPLQGVWPERVNCYPCGITIQEVVQNGSAVERWNRRIIQGRPDGTITMPGAMYDKLFGK